MNFADRLYSIVKMLSYYTVISQSKYLYGTDFLGTETINVLIGLIQKIPHFPGTEFHVSILYCNIRRCCCVLETFVAHEHTKVYNTLQHKYYNGEFIVIVHHNDIIFGITYMSADFSIII